MQVTVIIVNYNSNDFLERCVEGLLAQTFKDFRAVIVDNGSEDCSIEKLGTLPDSFEVIRNGENLGFARANNLAAQQSQSEWIATLNPDAIPEPDWLQQLVAATRRHPRAVMFGSTQISGRSPSVLDGTGDVYHAYGVAWRANIDRPVASVPAKGETFGPCAAATLYRREEFLTAGGFDEHFYCYCEDIDLAFRLRLQGHWCVQIPCAVVRHFGSAITGKRSDFTMYYSTRNRYWTFIKNMPGPLLVPILPFHLVIHAAFILRALMNGYGRAVLRATRDMLMGIQPILDARRTIQKSRRISASAVAAMLTWFPLKLLTRGADTRPAAD
jgi:GT2 family glycosyltransferase